MIRCPAYPSRSAGPIPTFLVDLGASVIRVYDLGRYVRTLRRGMPLPEATALTPEDRAWAASVSRPAVHENS